MKNYNSRERTNRTGLPRKFRLPGGRYPPHGSAGLKHGTSGGFAISPYLQVNSQGIAPGPFFLVDRHLRRSGSTQNSQARRGDSSQSVSASERGHSKRIPVHTTSAMANLPAPGSGERVSGVRLAKSGTLRSIKRGPKEARTGITRGLIVSVPEGEICRLY